MVVVVARRIEFLAAGREQPPDPRPGPGRDRRQGLLHRGKRRIVVDPSRPERADRHQVCAAEWALLRLREHSGLFRTVEAFRALHHVADPRQRPIGCRRPVPDPEVQTVEVLVRITEERLHPAIVLDHLTHHEPEQRPETDLGVVFRIPGPGEVTAHPCLQVRPAERRGIGGGDEEVICGTPCRGIDKRRRCPEGIEIDGIERSPAHQDIRIPMNHLGGKTQRLRISPGKIDRSLVPVVDRHRYPDLVCHPETPGAGCPHGIEVIVRLDDGEQEDGGVPVHLHARVVKDRAASRRELEMGILSWYKKTGSSFDNLDNVHASRKGGCSIPLYLLMSNTFTPKYGLVA